MTPRSIYFALLSFSRPGLLLIAVLGSGVSQAESEGSRIVAVTVYPGSATIERVAKVPAGAKTLTFTCLPASLDQRSLAVSVDASARVGELSVRRQPIDASPECQRSALDGRIRELEDKKAVLGAEHAALILVTDYLKSTAAADGASTVNRGGDPKLIASVADALRRTGQEALVRQHQIARAQQALERELAPLLGERSLVRVGRDHVVAVTVTLDASRDTEVRLSYQVSGPGWLPTYRGTLDTQALSLKLDRQAMVTQNTGEDWLDVAMTLSTGQPSRATAGPSPTPWRIGVAKPPEPARRSQETYAMAAAPAAPAPMGGLSPEDSDPTSFVVVTETKGYATQFRVPQRINVPSNKQSVVMTLGDYTTKVQLFSRSTPQREASAWLVAQASQPDGVWPSGAMQLYRDGAYVGTGALQTGGGGPLSLSFGRDELVSVQVQAQKDMQTSVGFIGSSAQRSVRRAYVIENRHTTPILLQVLESAPVTTHELVAVKADFSPLPESLAWNKQPGVALWSTSLAAAKTARFEANYLITYPKDAQLDESP